MNSCNYHNIKESPLYLGYFNHAGEARTRFPEGGKTGNFFVNGETLSVWMWDPRKKDWNDCSRNENPLSGMITDPESFVPNVKAYIRSIYFYLKRNSGTLNFPYVKNGTSSVNINTENSSVVSLFWDGELWRVSSIPFHVDVENLAQQNLSNVSQKNLLTKIGNLPAENTTFAITGTENNIDFSALKAGDYSLGMKANGIPYIHKNNEIAIPIALANLSNVPSSKILNKPFIDKIECQFSQDEIAVIKAIKSASLFNANPARKYTIRFLCNKDADYNYNICIADKLTGEEQIIHIKNVENPNGLNFHTLKFNISNDPEVTMKLAIDYSILENKVYMNFGIEYSNLILSEIVYTDVMAEDIEILNVNLRANAAAISSIYIEQDPVSWSVGYWTETGIMDEYANYGHSNYLKCKPGSVITVSHLGSVGTGAAAKVMNFFDANFNWVCYSDSYHVMVTSDLSANYHNIRYVSFSTSDYIEFPAIVVISIDNDTQIDKIDSRLNVLDATKGKSLAILGDSIMMLMRTNSVGTNLVTYVGSNGNVYPMGQLTDIGGRLWVTTSLVNGVATGNSIECTIKNSQQENYDAQNWDALKAKLRLSDLINCGLGGGTIAERPHVTAFPYSDGDDNTSCLSNQARMLKRIVDNGRKSPDMIMIWAGANGAGEPTTDNFDEIMALSWSSLAADNAEGHNYRWTFYGGLRYTVESLYRNFSNSIIFVFSPIQTNPADYRTYKKLSTTSAALEKMARRYSCIFCDALNESGIVDLLEKADGSGRWLGDGLHPNEAGKILLKNYAAKKLCANYFSKTN